MMSCSITHVNIQPYLLGKEDIVDFLRVGDKVIHVDVLTSPRSPVLHPFEQEYEPVNFPTRYRAAMKRAFNTRCGALLLSVIYMYKIGELLANFVKVTKLIFYNIFYYYNNYKYTCNYIYAIMYINMYSNIYILINLILYILLIKQMAMINF